MAEAGAPVESSCAWYAIYTKHQHEKTARDILARKNFEVLLPLYRSIHRWKDRNKVVDLPLFPCYVFIRANLERKVEILKTAGVFWLVESGGHACAIPDHEIEAVLRITGSESRVEPHPYLRTGDRVRIQRGALAGIEGILTRFKSQYRVVLSMELLRKAIAVEVDLSTVERLPSAIARVAAAESLRVKDLRATRK
jgi:transcription elongation factor/antiterminator RfaH